MPLINLRTSLASIEHRDELLLELSAKLVEQSGKPEDYVMTLLETDVPMTFAGSLAPAAFCELITSRTGIPANRIYICFEDVPASSLGWNGRTFG